MSARTLALDHATMRDGATLPASLRESPRRWLWAIALATFVVGDLATTQAGVAAGYVEANPALTGIVAGHGLLGMAAVKTGFVAVFAAVAAAVGRPHNIGVPAALSLVGVAATAWNLLILSGVLG